MANKPESAEPNESQQPEPDQPQFVIGLLATPVGQILLYALLALTVLLVLGEFHLVGF